MRAADLPISNFTKSNFSVHSHDEITSAKTAFSLINKYRTSKDNRGEFW